jgi:hypothetical protein
MEGDSRTKAGMTSVGKKAAMPMCHVLRLRQKNNLKKNQIFLQQEFPKSKNYTIFVSFR